eukprot:s2769_g10.t1
MEKATQMGITVHHTWSVGELRQLIQEKKRSLGETSDIPKGLASMNKTQLLEQCKVLGLEVPEKATNGLLTLLIRDSCAKNKGDAVVTFGRHRGKLFKEVPRNYLEWAVQEVKQRGPEGSSPDLVSLSTYAAQVLKTVSGEMVAPAGEVNDLLGGRLEPAHTGGPGHEQRGGLRQPAQGQKLDAGADAKGTDEISIHKEDTRPRRERRVRFSEDEPRCTAGRSSGDGGAYGSIGLVTGQVQHLGHGHPGGYESEGELTDRQQESPDGLMVVSIDHEKQSYSPDDGKFFDCQENAAAEVVGSDVFSAESRAQELLAKRDFSFESCEKVAGDDQILRVGDLCGDHEAGCNRTQNIDNEAHVASHAEPKGHGEHHGASAIHFDPSVPKHVQSALSRLHQNLGHPKIEDMMRHLRYAGAEEAILKACKKMRCDVCLRNQKTGCARPAVLPSLLDMNQLVSVDVFSVFDSNRVRHEFLSIIDHSTTFHLVAELEGHSGEDFCKQFTQVWGNVFGAPGTISADLESGLQVGVSKYAEFHGCKLRTSAGQAHWQQGIVERHGLWYQEILQRVIDEKSITSEDMYMAVQAVNSAKNELRRRHGFSPSQAVFGRPKDSRRTLLRSRRSAIH